MKTLKIILAGALLATSGFASAQTLQELAAQVDRAVREEGQLNEQREAEFLRDRNNQRALLAQAQQELANQEARSDRLKNEYDVNERDLAELETVLQERMGNLGELFGIVRQASGDLQSALDDSMVSAQFPGRGDFLADIAQRKELPNVTELRQIWASMVTEIAESGKVVRFAAPVERANGEKQELDVVRVGVFNAVSNGSFLDWDRSMVGVGISTWPTAASKPLRPATSTGSAGAMRKMVSSVAETRPAPMKVIFIYAWKRVKRCIRVPRQRATLNPVRRPRGNAMR